MTNQIGADNHNLPNWFRANYQLHVGLPLF